MGQQNGHRHELFGFIAGEAEHQALVTGTASIHSPGNVERLALYGGHHSAGIGVEAKFGSRVTDIPNHTPHQVLIIQIGARGNLTGHDDQSGRQQGFAGHAPLGVLGEHRIEHGIGNLIGNLIGVTLGHRLGREQIVSSVRCQRAASLLRVLESALASFLRAR